MADVCPDCGRPTINAAEHGWAACIRRGSHSCEIVAAAYQRGRRDGIDEGVRIAKAYARAVDIPCGVISYAGVKWDRVDAAAEKAKGE